ncbi:LysR family transcriptional regulator [Afipia felis]
MIALDNIRIFMRSAELGSFSAAGRSLRMSPSVISYRIQALEEHLNCRLVSRTTRRMNLTEAGRIFYDKCVDIIDTVERAETSVVQAGASPRGALKVTAPLRLGRRVLSRVAVDYRCVHPETDIHLRLSDHLIDLVQDSVDIAIRMGQLRDSTFTLRKVAEVERVICAAPSYLEKYGEPKTPEELRLHQCLLLRFPGSHQYRWPLIVNSKVVLLDVSGGIDADDTDFLVRLALSGQGIVMMPLFDVAEELANGKLVPILTETPPVSVTLGVLYPSRKMLPPRVKAFVEMTIAALRCHITHELQRIDEVSKQPLRMIG